MMNKKFKIPYTLKKAGLGAMIVALPVLSSCEKEKDPIQEKIDQLTALEKVQAKEVRAAVEPAKFVESNVSSRFGTLFNDEVNLKRGGVQPANLRDSSEVFVGVVEEARRLYGNPLSHNNTTMTALHDKSKTYIVTFDELAKLSQGR